MLLTKPLREDPRVHREARALQEAGHDVLVVQWARRDPDAPPEETLDGVPLVRVPSTGLMRALGHDVLREPLWWRAAYETVHRLHQRAPFDAVHCHDLDTLPAGVRLKDRLGLRLVFDAHEIFHEMIEGNVPWPVPAVARRLEARLLPRVDALITASDNFAKHYRARVTCPVTVVWNAFLDAPTQAAPAPPTSPFTIVYIGTLSRDRLFPGLVRAIGGITGARLIIGGKREGVFDEVEAEARRHPNVTFLGPVPFQDVPRHTASAHLLVSMLDPANTQYRVQLPNKVFDAMATGRPVVVSDGTEQARFVREHKIGEVCAYEEDALRGSVTRLMHDPERAAAYAAHGLRLARERFHWAPQAKALVAAYGALERA